MELRTLALLAVFLLHVGCDGVVGSDKRWDACGECGGSNSSCRLFSGLFSNHASLQAGYNLVTTLPRGACNVSVSEMTPSRNYLALRRPGGQFLLNGDWQVGSAGDYEAGGVTFVYRPQDTARGEALTARGPLSQPVDLMVLFQQSQLAIKYEYTLPLEAGVPPLAVPVRPPPHHHGGHHHPPPAPPPAPPLLGFSPADDVTVRDGPAHDDKPRFPFSAGPVGDQPPVAALRPRSRRVRKYGWRLSGLSECSKSCGGGVQSAAATCVREHNQAAVPEKRCAGQERPPAQTLRCNVKPCPAMWEAGEWSSCSATCGAGVQSRPVVCRQHISASLTMKVAEGACLGTVLERTRHCQAQPCSGARWTAAEWGPCAAPCGKGARGRSVHCVTPEGNELGLEMCDPAERPELEESCDAGPCGGPHLAATSAAQWLVSEWAQHCSEECGTGVQTRRVVCSSEHACDVTSRPEASRACASDKQCVGKWFAGPWGQCSSSCGHGRQSRDVVCVSFVRGQFRVDVNCPASLKPPVERACSERPCGPDWFMSDWNQCSHSCGSGSQRRDVRCLDEAQRPASQCAHELRPAVRRACNTQPCQTQESSAEEEHNLVGEAPRERLHARGSHQLLEESGDQPSSPQDHEELAGGACVDKFTNCALVVQARLCRYKYYRTACCVACHRKAG